MAPWAWKVPCKAVPEATFRFSNSLKGIQTLITLRPSLLDFWLAVVVDDGCRARARPSFPSPTRVDSKPVRRIPSTDALDLNTLCKSVTPLVPTQRPTTSSDHTRARAAPVPALCETEEKRAPSFR